MNAEPKLPPRPAANPLDALAARRDEAVRRLDAARAKLAPVEDALCDARDDFKLGQFPEAQAAIAELQPQVSAMQAEIAALDDTVVRLNAEIQAAQDKMAREAAARAEAARPRQIAEAAAAYRAALQAVDGHAKAFAGAMRVLFDAGPALAAAAGTAEARRLYSFRATHYRLLMGLYNIFRQSGRGADYALTHTEQSIDILGLGKMVNPADPNAKRNLLDINFEIVDEHGAFFLDEAEARAACRRRDPTGESLFVFKRPDGIFILQAGRRRMQGAA